MAAINVKNDVLQKNIRGIKWFRVFNIKTKYVTLSDNSPHIKEEHSWRIARSVTTKTPTHKHEN